MFLRTFKWWLSGFFLSPMQVCEKFGHTDHKYCEVCGERTYRAVDHEEWS